MIRLLKLWWRSMNYGVASTVEDWYKYQRPEVHAMFTVEEWHRFRHTGRLT